MIPVLTAVAGLALGAVLIYLYFSRINKTTFRKSDEVLEEARRAAEKVVVEAKTQAVKLKDEADKVVRDERRELKEFENRLLKKEDVIEKRSEGIAAKEKSVETRGRDLEKKERDLLERDKEIAKTLEEEKQTLHRIAGMTRDEAVKLLMDKLEPELERDKAELIRKRLDSAKENAEAEAKRVITMAIQRFAASHTADSVVSVVDLPSEDMKGR